MGIAYDTAKFLANVKRDCFTARSDDNWTDQNIMGVGDDCLLHHVCPVMKSTKQEWFRADAAYTLVSGQSTYDLPDDAMWFGVEAIHLVNVSDGSIAAKMQLAEPSSRQMYAGSVTGNPVAYWLNQTTFTVTATPDSNAVSQFSLLASYYRRPGQMCLTTDVAALTAIGSGSCTIASTPAFFTANATSPYALDIRDKDQPHTLRAVGFTTSSLSPISLGSLTSTQQSAITAGDIVSLHGTTSFPDAPPELFPLLQKLTSQTILTAQTDPQGLSAYVQQQQADLEKMLRGIANRNDGTARKLSLYHSAVPHTAGRQWLGWPSR